MRALAVVAALLLTMGTATLGAPAARADDEPSTGVSAASTPTPTAARKTPTSEPTDEPKSGEPESGEPESSGTSSESASPAESSSESATPEKDAPTATPEPAESAEDTPSSDPTPSGSSTPAPSTSASTGARLAAAAADCTPSDVSDSVSDFEVSNSSGSDTWTAWESGRLDFSGSLPDGGCAGDFVRITVPDEFRAFNGSYPVTAPDGTQMGTMVVADGVLTLTFNDYIETHQNVTYDGFIELQLLNTLEPGKDYELSWPVGDETFTTPVTTGPCPDCQQPNTNAWKWAQYDAGPPPAVDFGLVSAVTRAAGEKIVITDRVGPGQEIDCSTVRVLMGDSLSTWGDIELDEDQTDRATVDCTTDAVTITIDSTASGQYYSLNGRANVTAERRSYADSGSISQAGVTSPVQANAVVQSGGASGNGDHPVPGIDIEKWSTADGPTAGDYDDTAKSLDPDAPAPISFTITNTGTEDLVDVKVADQTVAGTGVVADLTCDFSLLGGPSSGVTWDGPFYPGDSFTCTGTLPALGDDATHTDTASVTAVGTTTKTPVDDEDDWNGSTPPGSSPTPTPTESTGTPTPTPTPTESTGTPTPTPTESESTPTSTPSPTESTPTETPSPSTTTSTPTSPSTTTTSTTTATTTVVTTSSGGGSLAQTGASSWMGAMAGLALLLITGGTALLIARRRRGTHEA